MMMFRLAKKVGKDKFEGGLFVRTLQALIDANINMPNSVSYNKTNQII